MTQVLNTTFELLKLQSHLDITLKKSYNFNHHLIFTTMPLDARQIKSRNKIFSAVVNLLSYKRLDEISVKEISLAANITRVTFYAHYSSVQDVVYQWLTEWLNMLLEEFSSFENQSNITPKERLLNFILYFFANATHNRVVLHHIVSGRTGEETLEQLKKWMIECFYIRKNNIQNMQLTDDILSFYGLFYSGALISLLNGKLSNNFQLSNIEIATLFVNTVDSGIGEIFGKNNEKKAVVD